MTSQEAVLAALLKEELARSKQQFATDQLAMRLLSSSATCQPAIESSPAPTTGMSTNLPNLSTLQSKVAVSLEIQRQLSQQQKSEQLLLNFQLLVAAQRKQQQQAFGLPSFSAGTCNGGVATRDLLPPAVVQQLALDAAAGNKRSSLDSMAMTYHANKRMRVQEEKKNKKLPTVPCRCRGMPDDHNPKTAFIVIPEGVKHGQALMCSHPICQARGVRFRYCASCRRPVAKRNFSSRHSHHHPLSSSSSTAKEGVEQDQVVEQRKTVAPAVSSEDEQDGESCS